jgi:hypothetical protein
MRSDAQRCAAPARWQRQRSAAQRSAAQRSAAQRKLKPNYKTKKHLL